MSSATPDDKHFPFFELPPEIRDWVYDCITTDALTIASPTIEAHLAVKHYPLLNLLLASRQLKQEYEKRAALSTTLIISDHEEFNFALLPMPARVVGVKNLQVRMFVVCESRCPHDKTLCEAGKDLEQSIDLISKMLLQLPNIDNLEVHLGFWTGKTHSFTWPDTPHDNVVVGLVERLSAVPQMSKLCLYRAEEQSLDATKIIDPRKLFATWRKSLDWEITESVGDNKPEAVVTGDAEPYTSGEIPH